MSAVSAEPATAVVLEWLARERDILGSDWLMTEAAAALAQKRRMQILSAQEHARALSALRDQIAPYSSLPVTRQDFRLAADFAGRPEAGLRAGDALHLAIAAAAGATLATLDKRQAEAGAALGVSTLLL